MLSARGVVVRHGDLVAVNDVDLDLRPGAVTALMGRNGAGKSTLLWALQGSGPLTAGLVRVGGADPRDLSPSVRRRAVGLVPQTPADLLYLHGGGGIAGTPRTQRKLVGAIAREANLRVWSIDYRLAPEKPYPAAVDDTVAAYRAMVERVDPRRLLLSGESGGGAIALSALLRARDAGLRLPAAVVLLCPWTDLTLSGKSTTENVGKDLLTPDFIAMCRDAYVGTHDPADPQVSPLFADLHGLPPTLLQVGALDLIRDDAVRYAKAAAAAGSPTDLRIWPKVGHGFTGTGDDLPESREAIAEIAAWIRTTIPDDSSAP